MDANKVDYCSTTKVAGTNDKPVRDTIKAPAKYVFKPEVVKSLPKYSQSVTSDGKRPRKSSGNGLRELFGRVTRNPGDIKSQERAIAERKRSRSLFLAHDHSKDSVKLAEYRGGRLDRRNNKNQPEFSCCRDRIDIRLRRSLDIERIDEPSRLWARQSANLSKNPVSNDRGGETCNERSEFCREEFRENGKRYSSIAASRGNDDRSNCTARNSERSCCQQEAVVREDHRRAKRNYDEIVDGECCSPRNPANYNLCAEIEKPGGDCQKQQWRETKSIRSFDPDDRYESQCVGSLRRVDSPYPRATNHIDHSSSTRDVTGVDEAPGKSSPRPSPRDESIGTISPGFHDWNSPVGRISGNCRNCGTPRSISHKETDNYPIVDDADGEPVKLGKDHSKIGKLYDFDKKPQPTCTTSGTGGLLYRSRSLPQLSVHDSGVASGNEHIPGRPTSRLVADLRQLLTLKQHYYPEGGWGWVILVVGVLVQILSHGLHGSAGPIIQQVQIRFGSHVYLQSGWLGAMSTGVALLVSPVTIAFCRKKSTRVTAVLGGLVTALGCLFTSFASQFHQLFFSYGTVVGIGVGMTRDCSTLMVAQYFKRRREFVEIFIVSGSGLGIAVMSAFIKGAISKIGWRLGLQAVTGVVFVTFILGTFYRSASLYHPQRRAILHLKNQKRKIKDKNRVDDRPSFFDFSTLKSKTVRILLVSTGISAFGINTPIFYLAHQAEEEGLGDTVILLQTYLGLAWTLGCVAFGLLVVHHSVECRIARQYLTQAAVFMCGLCILALTAVHGNYHGYVMFTWIYGIFCGGYHYSLKMYTYERVRARNFARTWGFVQCSQAIPIAIGVPISGYINVGCGGKAGYYFSSTCVLVGSFTLFFIDLHRRNLSRHKHTRANGTRHLCVSDNCPQRRRLSFTQDPENEGASAAAAALVLGAELAPGKGEIIDALGADKPELTCISEEGIADMDLPDNLLDDLDYMGDCITSCNKVENYLMLSEFENNLIAEMPIIMDRKGRRWSLARSKPPLQGNQNANDKSSVENGNGKSTEIGEDEEEEETKVKWHLAQVPATNRLITVIDEGST